MLSPADFLEMQGILSAEVPRRCACGQEGGRQVLWSCELGAWICSYCWFKKPEEIL